VLSTLVESGPLTQIELATALAVDRTAMVYLIDELEERELVRRDRKPGDRRSFLITLTDNGRNTQRKAAAALRTGAEALLEPLEEAERTQLVALLGAIVEHWQAGQA
jgi:DNA-binding MarR family transcriptional regulator